MYDSGLGSRTRVLGAGCMAQGPTLHTPGMGSWGLVLDRSFPSGCAQGHGSWVWNGGFEFVGVCSFVVHKLTLGRVAYRGCGLKPISCSGINQWTSRILVAQISGRNVATCIPHKAFEYIACGKLTFHERSVAYRVVRVQDSGSGAQGSGFRVQGAGCRVQGAGCRVEGEGWRVKGGCRVQGTGSRE